MTSVDSLDPLIQRYHLVLDEFFKGNSEPAKEMFSHLEDVSLANPFGPVARGWKQVAQTMEGAASHYRDGEATHFEAISRYVTSDLAYIVEVERYKAKVGGGKKLVPVALRATSIFRPEEGTWKIVHRHADPITTTRSAESVVQAES